MQLFPSSTHIPTVLPLPPLLPSLTPSHPFKSEVSKNMASYSTRYKSKEEKTGKKAVPPSRADWRRLEALGVRHSSSSFLHWHFYKQVSNAPDLVWQTFSKEDLKRGWESDTPTCAFWFFFSFLFLGGTSRIRSPLTLLLFNHCHLSLSLCLLLPFVSCCFLLWEVSCGPLNCTRNSDESRKKTF